MAASIQNTLNSYQKGGELIVSDIFDHTNNPIWNNANWNQGCGTIISDSTWYGGTAYNQTNDPGGLAYYDGSFNANQYSETIIAHRENGGYYFGPAVRVSLNNGYCLGTDTVGYRLFKIVSSVYTLITSGSVTISDGDTFKLTISGTTLKMYRNDIQFGGDQTDNSLSSGSPGIGGYGYDSYECDTSFEGGDL